MPPRVRVRRLVGALRAATACRLGVDPRALVALRVALGGLLLADLLLRARSLVFFYTDAGALPRSLLHARFPLASRLSVHTLSGEPWWTGLLFVVAGVAALALLAGRRTRTAAIVSWLLLVSLHARNPVVLNGGDSLLRRTLFWSLFLPLGAGLSLDAARDAVGRRTDGGRDSGTGPENGTGAGGTEGSADRARCTHPAAAALLVQPVVLYVVNAAIKLRGDAWPSGRAVRMVFDIDSLTVLAGDALAGHPALLEALGLGWLALLCVSPLLLVTTGRRRTATVAAFAGAHLGMALTLGVGLFPLVSVAALLPLLPPAAWDRIERRWPGRALERRIRRHERRVHTLGRRIHAFVGRAPTVGSVSSTLPSAGVAVDANPSRLRDPLRRIGRVASALLLVAVLLWNAAALGYVDAPETEAVAVSPTESRWDMFAPAPPTRDVRYVAAGTLRSGDRVEAIRGGRVTWERPDGLWTSYPGARWRKYLETVRWTDDDALREGFAAGLCERWNRAHDGARTLESLRLYRVERRTRLDGPEPSERVRVGEYACSTSG